MNATGEFHIEPLLDRLEKIHHEVMGNVESAQRENIFIFAPFALNEFDVQPLLLEKSVFDRAENGGLTSDPDVADADLARVGDLRRAAAATASQGKAAESGQKMLSRNLHFQRQI